MIVRKFCFSGVFLFIIFQKRKINNKIYFIFFLVLDVMYYDGYDEEVVDEIFLNFYISMKLIIVDFYYMYFLFYLKLYI